MVKFIVSCVHIHSGVAKLPKEYKKEPEHFPKLKYTKAVLKKSLFLSFPNRYLYTANAKVGSTTCKRTLILAEYRSKGYVVPDDLNFDINRMPRWQGLPNLLTSPTELTPRQLGDFAFDPAVFKFAFVRDPFSRAFSCYLDKIHMGRKHELRAQLEEFSPRHLLKKDWSFEDFLEVVQNQPDNDRDLHWRTQSRSLFSEDITQDFVAKFEAFDRDLQSILEEITRRNNWKMVPPIVREAPHSTQGRARLAENMKTSKAITLVRKIYEEDYDRYGY